MPERRPLAVWLEAGLDVAALLFVPVLVLAPRGIAPLAAIAGAIAAGFLAASRPVRARALAPLAVPAALLGMLLLWGLISALWSLHPLRSIVLDTRLAGMFTAALALAAASRSVAAPQRLTFCLLIGLALGLLLAGIELASNGALIGPLLTRRFRLPRLNQASVTMAILLMPASAALFQQRLAILAASFAAASAVMIYLLVGDAAKLALVAGVSVAALFYCLRRGPARAAALVTALVILTAPATFPQFVRLPAIVGAMDSLGGHVEESGVHRLLIWSFAGERIAERPLAGWGLDASRAIPGGGEEIRPAQSWMPLHPHNAALQVWLELGVPGAILFASIMALLWLRLADTSWPRLYAAAAGGGLFAALVASLGTYGIWQEWWLGTLTFSLFLVLVMARTAEAAAATAPSAPPEAVRAAE